MTLSEMRQALSDRLVDPDDVRWSSTEKDAAINWAYRELVVPAGWPRKVITLEAVGASTSEYVAPSGVEVAQIHFLKSHALVRSLVHTTTERAFQRYTNWESVTGQPDEFVTDYTQTDAGALVFKIFPDGGTALTDLMATVSIVPATLTDDVTPACPSNFHEAIVDGAAAKLVLDANQARDTESAGVWMGSFLAKRAEFAAWAMRLFSSASRSVPYRNV